MNDASTGAEWEANDNIDGRFTNGWFVLSTGGDIKTSTPLQSWLEAAPVATPSPAVNAPGAAD